MVGESRIADAPVATDTHAVVALSVDVTVKNVNG